MCPKETAHLKVRKIARINEFKWRQFGNRVALHQTLEVKNIPYFRLCKLRASGSPSICTLDLRPECTCSHSRTIQQFPVHGFCVATQSPTATSYSIYHWIFTGFPNSDFRKKKSPRTSSFVNYSIKCNYLFLMTEMEMHKLRNEFCADRVGSCSCRRQYICILHSNVNQNRNGEICNRDVEFIFRSPHGSASATTFG